MPKKLKHRKSHKAKKGGVATRRNKVSFGDFGLVSTEGHWITARQIESARRVMSKFTKKGGKIWIRIFPDIPVTKKGGEIPMGKGKGSVDYYIANVKPEMIMFEMGELNEETCRKAMALAAYKLPVKCKIITR